MQRDESRRAANACGWTVELHRHFEAGLRAETIARLAARHGVTSVRTRSGKPVAGIDPQDPDSVRRYYAEVSASFGREEGFALFADSFGLPLSVLRTTEDLAQAVFEQLVDCAERGSLHTELRGSPFTYLEHVEAPVEEVATALVAGVDRAWGERRVSGTFVLAFSRQKGLPGHGVVPPAGQARQVAEIAAKLHSARRPVGLDIAGYPELPFPPRLFVEALAPAREAGVPLTVHAGEQAGPPHYALAPPALVVEAIECLGARRIGHGTALAASPEARAVAIDRGVAIECCPVSNACMGFVPLERHPLPLFLEEGLLASVSTDDPLMFGPFTVGETLQVIAGPLRLDSRSLDRLQHNALETAFVSEERRVLLKVQAKKDPPRGSFR